MGGGELTREEYAIYRRQAYYVARRYVPTYPLDDMIAEGLLSLVTSLRKYDPASKMCLLGYVGKRMRWAMLDAARAMRLGSRDDSDRGVFYAEVPTESLDETAAELTVPAVANTDKIDLHRAIAMLPQTQRKFLLAWLECDDVAKAAAKVGISTGAAWQHHWQAVRALRKLMA